MQILARDVGKILKKEKLDPALLEKPPKPEMGDLAFPCFSLAREMGKAPAEIAKGIAAKARPSGTAKEIRAMGPYVNFFVNRACFADDALSGVHREQERTLGRSVYRAVVRASEFAKVKKLAAA